MMASPVALFDLDNTLVDRQPFRDWATDFCHDRGLGDAAADWFCDQDDDGFASRLALFEAARVQFALGESAEELVASYRDEYPRYFAPDSTVLACLESVKDAGWRVGIVTNGPASQIDKIDRCGLRPLLDGWCISAVTGFEKPDPRIFVEAIRRCGGSEGSQVWMIGDTADTDIAGGRRAGCGTIWLSRGRPWSIPSYTPDLAVDSLCDATDALLAALDVP